MCAIRGSRTVPSEEPTGMQAPDHSIAAAGKYKLDFTIDGPRFLEFTTRDGGAGRDVLDGTRFGARPSRASAPSAGSRFYNARPMTRPLLERRLIDVSDRLKRLRADLAVAEEQCATFAAEADDARLRALVSETPLAEAEAHEVQRHADAHTRNRDALLRSIRELEREQDTLLDRMASELSS